MGRLQPCAFFTAAALLCAFIWLPSRSQQQLDAHVKCIRSLAALKGEADAASGNSSGDAFTEGRRARAAEQGGKAAKLAAYRQQIVPRMQQVEANRHKNPSLTDGELWDLYVPLWDAYPIERIGTFTDGGKWISDVDGLLTANPECTVYSLGSNGDTSFESAVLQRSPQCTVHTFDHTLRPKVAKRVSQVPGIEFHPLGITSAAHLSAVKRGEAKFLDPLTLRPIESWRPEQFTTILGSMQQLQLPWLDVLKIDIEGSEWAVFQEMVASEQSIPITQILIEMHLPHVTSGGGLRLDVLDAFFKGLWRHGFVAFSRETNYHAPQPRDYVEYSFIKIDARGDVVTRFSKGFELGTTMPFPDA